MRNRCASRDRSGWVGNLGVLTTREPFLSRPGAQSSPATPGEPWHAFQEGQATKAQPASPSLHPKARPQMSLFQAAPALLDFMTGDRVQQVLIFLSAELNGICKCRLL